MANLDEIYDTDDHKDGNDRRQPTKISVDQNGERHRDREQNGDHAQGV